MTPQSIRVFSADIDEPIVMDITINRVLTAAELEAERLAMDATRQVLGNTRWGRLTVDQRKECIAVLKSGASEKVIFQKYFAIVFPENQTAEVA